MLQYISITKKINAIELMNFFFIKIVLKFGILNSIVINRENIFTSAF